MASQVEHVSRPHRTGVLEIVVHQSTMPHPAERQSVELTKIRVGFVMHVMQVAGAEVLVKQIIERLSAEIDATVFCLDALGELGQRLLDNGIPVVVLNRKPGFDRGLIRKLAKEVREREIQVMHAHQYTPFFYTALARAVGGCKTKIVFTEHGRHYPDVVSWKRRLVNRLFLQRYADVSTACCDFSARAVEANDGFTKVVTLRNGVDINLLPARGSQESQNALRQRLGLSPHIKYVACVARFHPIKDHPTLLRAWKHVVDQLPNVKLLLVGDGADKQACQEKCREWGMADKVEFWGIRHDIAEILRAVDVFALTSISEAASLTLLEAMASECPCVVTDVGGNAEHLKAEVHGFLAPRGDDVAIAKYLCRLLQDERLSRTLGAAARQQVVEHFTMTKTVEAYRAYFRQLTSS
jgi:L-malate glycosyltransferase